MPLPDPRQRPARGQPLEVLALDHEAHRPGDVDHERRGAVLERGAGRERGGDRDRAGLGVPGGQRGGAGEGQQRQPAVGALEQHGRHVAGLVVGQPVLVVLDLAEHGHDRHQHPAPRQHGQRLGVRRPARRDQPASTLGQRGGRRAPSSPANPGSGIARFSAGLDHAAPSSPRAVSRTPKSEPI